MALQIIVILHPNPNARSYSLNHAGQKMSGSSAVRTFNPPFKVLGQSWYEIGVPGRAMLARIFRELGDSISLILLRPKELLLVKKESADWDMIDPCVVNAIKRAFDPKAKD